MKAPDRIFFAEDFVCGINCNKPVPGKRNVEYIRKDALLEWLENKIKIPDVSFINGLTYLAYQDVIEHINEM